MIVDAKDKYDRRQPYRTYAQTGDSDSDELSFIASRISGLLGPITSGNGTESAAGAAGAADAGAADDPAANIDEALRECEGLLKRTKAILSRSQQALEISKILFGKTEHYNCLPHPFRTKSNKIQQASRKIAFLVAFLVRAVESCDSAMKQLANLISSFTDEQSGRYKSIRAAVDEIIAELVDCGIKLYREKRDSWDKRAEGKWVELFYGDELLGQMLYANTMMFQEKRVRPDWLIGIHCSGKIYILILELDEHR